MNKKQQLVSRGMTIFILTFCMSLVLSLINIGWSELFIQAWLKAWLIAFVVATPLSFLIPIATNKLVQRYIE